MGQLFTSFLIGYALFQVPAGKIGDSIGPKVNSGSCSFALGGTTFLMGLLSKMLGCGVAAFVRLEILRFLLGAGTGQV
jgi:MFS family permease